MSTRETLGTGKGRRKSTYPKIIPAKTQPILAGKPACPTIITGEAKAEWDRMLTLLENLGTLSQCDGQALALYCIQYARWVEAEKQLAANGCTQVGQGFARQSPWLAISNEATKIQKELLKEFGLTPASRAKLMPEQEQPKNNAVLDFLKKKA